VAIDDLKFDFSSDAPHEKIEGSQTWQEADMEDEGTNG
jgi:hypothetical protein